MEQQLNQLLPKLALSCEKIFEQPVDAEHQLILQGLADKVQVQLDQEKPVSINFICTHNSRRSQLAQVWASVASYIYGIPLNCLSGGTETTAFNPRAVQTLIDQGFKINSNGNASNPTYHVSWSEHEEAIPMFSKTYDNEVNNQHRYFAVMTCAHAEQNCPFIPEAMARVSLPFDDPKESDNTSEEKKVYYERSMQIASEMFYLMSRITKKQS